MRIYSEGALQRFLTARALGNVPPAEMKNLRTEAAKQGRTDGGAQILDLAVVREERDAPCAP